MLQYILLWSREEWTEEWTLMMKMINDSSPFELKTQITASSPWWPLKPLTWMVLCSPRHGHHAPGCEIQGDRAALPRQRPQHADCAAFRGGPTAVPHHPPHQHGHGAELEQTDAHEKSPPAHPKVRDPNMQPALFKTPAEGCECNGFLIVFRFTADAEVDLKDSLSALGITDMFSVERADFRHLSE